MGTPNVTYTMVNGNTVSSLSMPGLLHKAVLSEVCGDGEGESETHVSGTGDQSKCGALRVTKDSASSTPGKNTTHKRKQDHIRTTNTGHEGWRQIPHEN